MAGNSEERILILKMLEEGKINSDEAARLLEALDKGAHKERADNRQEYNRQADDRQENKSEKFQKTFQDEISKARDRLNEWKKEFKTNTGGKDFDHVVEEFADKMERLAKNVASTTFGIVDKVIDFVGSFVDTNSFRIFGNFATTEKVFEAYPAENSDITVEGINGYIIVKKHLDNKVVIKSKIKSSENNKDSIVEFNENEKGIILKLNKQPNISVSHEVFLPVVKFNNIKLETSNGRIYVEDSISNSFISITKNSHIELMGVNSDMISVNTKNAKIQISYIVGKNIDIITQNSVIDVKHVKTQNLKAATGNGRITIENVQSYDESSCINMDLKTSNGGIKVNMNDMDNKGYKVMARTTGGGINILIPEITYHNINKNAMGDNYVEAESNNFDSLAEKVVINAQTANGYIEIMK
jgi:DUF4097 and DUF4098 domain-containing protein YvlB